MIGNGPYLFYCCGFKALHIILHTACFLQHVPSGWNSSSHLYRVDAFSLTVWKMLWLNTELLTFVCVFNVGHRSSFTLSHRAGWRKRKWCRDGRKFVLRCSCGFVLPSHCFFLFHALSLSVVLSHLPLTASWLSPWQLQVWITSCLG